MSPRLLIASGEPRSPEWFRLIQESFGRDNSVPRLVTALVVLLAIPILGAMTYNFLQKRWTGGDINRPATLYRRVLHRLPLGRAQRAIAWRMARDLELHNPTVLLLSAELFEHQAARWMRDLNPRRREALLSSAWSGLPVALFGPGYLTRGSNQGNAPDVEFQLNS